MSGETITVDAKVRGVGDMARVFIIPFTSDNNNFNFKFDPERFYVSYNGTKNVLIDISDNKNLEPGFYQTNVTLRQIIPFLNSTFDGAVQPILIEVMKKDPLKIIITSMRNNILTYISPFIIVGILTPFIYRIIPNNIPPVKKMDILSVNGSIITGVLIFLTLGSSFTEVHDKHMSDILTKLPTLLAASIVVPFSISAILYITKKEIKWGLFFVWIGFVYLIISMSIVVLVR
jgi:hypothetical protein